MGNVYSIVSTRGGNVTTRTESNNEMDGPSASKDQQPSEQQSDSNNDNTARKKAKEKEMKDFVEQLNIKREQRREILARHRDEKEKLKQTLSKEKENAYSLLEQNNFLRKLLNDNNIAIPESVQTTPKNSEVMEELANMRDELDNLKDNNLKLRRDLAESNFSLQNAYSDIADITQQNTESIKQINALKEVITVSKTLIGLREQQLNELKNKLNEIEKSLADREASMLSTDLRQEYERQLQNIRTLRGLYEERARLAEVTRQGLVRELEEQKVINQVEVNKCNELTSKINELEHQSNSLKQELEAKEEQLRSSEIETQGLKSEMSVVNKLFSQVLLGYKSDPDLDKLVLRLEENHELLTQMAETYDGSETSSALPKMLLELVCQVDEDVSEVDCAVTECGDPVDIQEAHTSSAAEIVQNLPKVWRVLMELLSHQSLAEPVDEPKVTTCYKSIETNSGPVLVPSVSQTYIRLKDLIMEKLALIKEVNRMKQLNTHLESRLGEQERRLCLVTTELSKTWHVVGRLRRHHHQLHTHEKILKYELQQKRKLLNELKEELEYCKEKWDQAREKNSQSEKDWRKLRAEFSNRKCKSLSTCNNSAESGYSDERPSEDSSESNDESEYVSEPLTRCKKKIKSSYETVVDSSTDFHVAEREDPASDMMDVADLPLDSQGDDESMSKTCSRDKLLKTEKSCAETEDEFCDIGNDSIVEDAPIALEDIIANIEDSESTSVNRSLSTTVSEQLEEITNLIGVNANDEDVGHISNNDKKFNNLEKEDTQHDQQPEDTINTPSSSTNSHFCTFEDVAPTTSSEIRSIDTKSILESIRRQNERLAKRDTRLNKLEEDCINIVQKLTATVNNGDQLSEKLDAIHGNRVECEDSDDDPTSVAIILDNDQSPADNSSQSSCNDAQPSTSTLENTNGLSDDNNLDSKLFSDDSEQSASAEDTHEARFAARDLRLKRLEEQTRSLVKKVNRTTSKGVKINYKLEELHNIYGSESSRAGTPFDENNVESNDDDDSIDD